MPRIRPHWALAVGLSLMAQPRVDFARDIQPILAASCQGCHGEKSQMGQLRLDSKAAALRTITSGTLYQRVAGTSDQARMPMGAKPLPADQIALIKRWVDEGAEWPDAIGAKSADIQKHWAFIPPV